MANFRPGDRSDAGAFFISAQAPLGRDFMSREFFGLKFGRRVAAALVTMTLLVALPAGANC
jgi:hypothetical protein